MRFLWAASAVALAAVTAHAAPRHERVVLPNGLVVLAIEDHSSGIAAFHLGVRLGWGTPGPFPRGVAALAQQVNKQRLTRWLTDPKWSLLHEETQDGGILTLNAEADFLEARGQATDANLERALALAGKSLFEAGEPTEPDVAEAKGTLLAANQTAMQRVVEVTYYELTRALYGRGSSLAGPVWGTDDDLLHVNASEVSGLARQRLGPNNACLCVVGPRSASSLAELARETFGGYGAAQQTVDPSPRVELGSPKVSVATLAGWRGASVMVGVPVPGYGERGHLAAQLAYMILSGPDGRVAQDPSIEETLGLNHIAAPAQSDTPVSLLPPMAGPRPFMAAHVAAQPRQVEAARRLLLAHFLAFAETPPSGEEMGRARKRLVNASALSLLSRINVAKALNLCQLYGADHERQWRLQEDVLSIRAEEITAMAREYFRHHAVGVVLPGYDERLELPEEDSR